MSGGGDKVALVTGAGKRLGRSIAMALAAAGYRVAVHYNASGAAAAEVVSEVEGNGGSAVAIGRDLADVAGAGALVADAAAALGPVTLLVNSASYYDSDSLSDLTPESWRALTDVNVAAPVMLMQAFARQFEEGRAPPAGASIVNLLDVQLSAPSPEFFSYFCAKAAFETATRLAALELAPHIRVNAVAPGLVLPSWGQTPAAFAARQALTPLGEGLGAADIVEAVRYLADARHVTGQVIAVDSGQRLYGFGNADVTPR